MINGTLSIHPFFSRIIYASIYELAEGISLPITGQPTQPILYVSTFLSLSTSLSLSLCLCLVLS